MTQITAHMVVKNEDQWIWYAISSVLPYVDKFLIVDTGSSDHTVKIIKSFTDKKIQFTQTKIAVSADMTSVRQKQIDQTKTPWIWIVDGDEVYPEGTAEEIVKAAKSNKFEGIVVRRFDLLGDIYHRQLESVGEYNLFGHRGHLVTRLVNKNKIKGLHLVGDYPLEGFYDAAGISTREHSPASWYITSSALYHAMYLKRSSLGSNLPMFNRTKYKIETGSLIDHKPPEVMYKKHPSYVPSHLMSRSLTYELAAGLITPIKKLKRVLISHKP